MSCKLLFIALIVFVSSAASEPINCETIDSDYSHDDHGNFKMCEMTEKTSIDVSGVALGVEKDESILGVRFYDNKNIFYLPVDVYKSYPNLVIYFGHSCNIKFLFKENFEHLGAVKELHLDNNRIQKLDGEMFEDMNSLQIIYLNYNKIKSVDEKAFVGLNHIKNLFLNSNKIEKIIGDTFVNMTSLEKLYLNTNDISFMKGESFTGLINAQLVKFTGNKCIDEDFLNNKEVATMGSIITEDCGSVDTHEACSTEWRGVLAQKIHEIDVLVAQIKSKAHEMSHL